MQDSDEYLAVKRSVDYIKNQTKKFGYDTLLPDLPQGNTAYEFFPGGYLTDAGFRLVCTPDFLSLTVHQTCPLPAIIFDYSDPFTTPKTFYYEDAVRVGFKTIEIHPDDLDDPEHDFTVIQDLFRDTLHRLVMHMKMLGRINLTPPPSC